jgi:hypothetical protein
MRVKWNDWDGDVVLLDVWDVVRGERERRLYVSTLHPWVCLLGYFRPSGVWDAPVFISLSSARPKGNEMNKNEL